MSVNVCLHRGVTAHPTVSLSSPNCSNVLWPLSFMPISVSIESTNPFSMDTGRKGHSTETALLQCQWNVRTLSLDTRRDTVQKLPYLSANGMYEPSVWIQEGTQCRNCPCKSPERHFIGHWSEKGSHAASLGTLRRIWHGKTLHLTPPSGTLIWHERRYIGLAHLIAGDRKQTVSINGTLGENIQWIAVSLRVLCAWTHSFHIAHIPMGDIIRHHQLGCHMYADDTQLYISMATTYMQMAPNFIFPSFPYIQPLKPKYFHASSTALKTSTAGRLTTNWSYTMKKQNKTGVIICGR